MKYKYLLWDLDGTITSSKQGIVRCIQYALGKLHYPCPPENKLDWVIGPPLFHSFHKLLDTEDEGLVHEAVRLYRERYQHEGILEHELFPGISELLHDLPPAGYINLLATSKAQVYAERILRHFELESCFAGGRGSDLNGHLADKKELIRAILEQIPPDGHEACLMIGDRYYDVYGARENQIDVAAVGYGYGGAEELLPAKPTYFCASVADLRSLLLKDRDDKRSEPEEKKRR